MRFDYAKNDAARAADPQDYGLEIFQLPNAKGDGEEDYAAVRPDDELLLTLTQDVYVLQDSPSEAVDSLNRIMLQAFNPDDIRAALIETGEYEDTNGDGDGELSPAGLDLVRTRARLSFRRSTNPKRDPLGTETLGQVAVWLIEKWSGKDTGKPQDFLPPSKSTGQRSKRTGSSQRVTTRSSSSRKSVSRAS